MDPKSVIREVSRESAPESTDLHTVGTNCGERDKKVSTLHGAVGSRAANNDIKESGNTYNNSIGEGGATFENKEDLPVASSNLEQAVREELFHRRITQCIDDGVDTAVRKVVEESFKHFPSNGVPHPVESDLLQSLTDTVERSIQELIQDINLKDDGDPNDFRNLEGDNLVSYSGNEHSGPDTVASDHFSIDRASSFADEFPHSGITALVVNSEGLPSSDSWVGSESSNTSNIVRAKVRTKKPVEIDCLKSQDGISSSHELEQLPDKAENEELKLAKWREAGLALRHALSHITSHKKCDASQVAPPCIGSTKTEGSGLHNCEDLKHHHEILDSVQQSEIESGRRAISPPLAPSFAGQVGENSCWNSLIQKQNDDGMNEMWESYDKEAAGDAPPVPVPDVNGKKELSTIVTDSDCKTNAMKNGAGEPQLVSAPTGSVAKETEESTTREPTLSELREKLKQLTSNLPVFAATDIFAIDKNRTSLKPHGKKSPRAKRNRTLSAKEEPEVSSSSDEEGGIVIKSTPPKAAKPGASHRGHGKRITHSHRSSDGTSYHVGAVRCAPYMSTKTISDNISNRSSRDMDDARVNRRSLDKPQPEGDMSSNKNKCINVPITSSSRKPISSSVTDTVPDRLPVMDNSEDTTENVNKGSFYLEDESTDKIVAEDEGVLHQAVTDKNDKLSVRSLLQETDSAANFADVESALESGKEKEPGYHISLASSEDDRLEMEARTRADMQHLGDLYACDDNSDGFPSLHSDSASGFGDSASGFDVGSQSEAFCWKLATSETEDNDHVTGGLDDLELLDDMPDIMISSDSESDPGNKVTLSEADLESLPEVHLRSSCSEDEQIEDEIDADDEFECDCFICQSNRENDTSLNVYDFNETSPVGSVDAEGQLEHSFNMDSDPNLLREYSPLPLNLELLRPWEFMVDIHQNNDVLEVMFQNVIMQMLSVYPDLLNDPAPVPVTPELFDSFPVITISEELRDEDAACPICLCAFGVNEKAKELPCRHVFHILCIKAWLQKAGTCPVCRQLLTTDSLNHSHTEDTTPTNDTS